MSIFWMELGGYMASRGLRKENREILRSTGKSEAGIAISMYSKQL